MHTNLSSPHNLNGIYKLKKVHKVANHTEHDHTFGQIIVTKRENERERAKKSDSS